MLSINKNAAVGMCTEKYEMSIGIRNKIIDMSHMNVCIPEKFEQSHAF